MEEFSGPYALNSKIMKKILFIFGTRPEAIKMAPLIKELQKHPERFDTIVCLTAQHREMLDQVITFFDIKADYDLNLMQPNQTLFDITVNGLKALEKVLDSSQPDIIVVQGDTTTAFIGALAGFYKKIQIAHLEAGLRSDDKYSPFPEEVNRVLTGHIADYHFAPTTSSRMNLEREGIRENIHVVGNTVIDALFLGLDIIKKQGEENFTRFFKNLDFNKKIILVTVHRRESFGIQFENICAAIKEIALAHPETEIVYPVHLNPNISGPANKLLKDLPNVHLLQPLEYPLLIWLMSKSYLILTDSGGIQEEGPALGKPVLVVRDVTERMEGVEAGTAKLLGTDKNTIVAAIRQLLMDKQEYQAMAQAVNPYGNGQTSRLILEAFSN
jgi:UDP-N-acetylglucosamine 2-epimerase (non-hydrolysing)